MDKIYIKNLELFGNHGVFKEEKKLGQKFILSMELFLNTSEAGKTDDLSKTVHYGELIHDIEKVFKKNSYDLIEKAAEEVALYILKSYDLINKARIILKKPFAPIGMPVEYVSVDITRQWHTAYISMGSNIGDKLKYIEDAKKLIRDNIYCKINKEAKIYETDPVGYEEQDKFINTAIEVKTILSPKELIALLLDIETKLKRERIIRWGPRTIDLDILLFDDIITDDEIVIIPHPRMHERSFVLDPLSDIAPYKIHPLINKRIIDMKETVKK